MLYQGRAVMTHKQGAHKAVGVFKKKTNPNDPDVRVADFSYTNDILAEMIVKAWTDPTFATNLTNHTNPNFAKTELANRGINLTRPIVLTEDEFFGGWEMDDHDEVVFVLPNKTRVTLNQPVLLETAKLLMACTPNGI
jgi:hypothetical protein